MIRIVRPNLQFPLKYVSICSKILRRDITVTNIKQRILKFDNLLEMKHHPQKYGKYLMN